jgi:two-component system, chemotaxis family, CheB/CheR fusion protein
LILTHTSYFVPVELKHRVFAKATRSTLRDRLLVMTQAGSDEAGTNLVSQVRTREAAFEAGPVAQVVIDMAGALMLANERARQMFGLAPRDIGRPVQDLELSYRPVELRSCIDQAYAERRVVSLREVEWRAGSTTSYLDIDVFPLVSNGNAPIGASVTFADVTRYRRLHDELVHSTQELETAYEELQSTNEELETTNEELQSTVEELETTNEELQSTNEELETMNEELQSTNEELQTMNDEMRQRSDALIEVNSFLQSILASLRQAVVVLDADLRVRVWNDRAHDLWGLREDEVVGMHFMNLEFGLPVGNLRTAIRDTLNGDGQLAEVTLPATTRRGRAISCLITCAPLRGAENSVRGAILLMEQAVGSDGAEPAAE